MPPWIATAILLPLTAFAFGAARGIAGPWSYIWAWACTTGIVLGLVYWHRYRGLGLAAIALLGALTASSASAAIGEWNAWTVAFTSAFLGVAILRLAMFFERAIRGTRHFNWGAVTCILCATVMLQGARIERLGEPPPLQFLWLPFVTGIATMLSLLLLFRPTFEFLSEPILWLMFRVKAIGPGLRGFPPRGPCIVIANHACWFDPLFLAKVLPRPITPMMISRFYDLPVLRWLLKHVFHTIRVPEQHYKKQETPDEILEAIAALDRGECLVLFPEGFLRRTEDKPLRRFGRGIWQILSARPETPVYCCWIEGAWGSYTSYFNGPPTKNKKKDFRRRIGVAVPAPIKVEPETLAHHLTTRIFLMNRVLESRKLLGLPDLPAFELPPKEDE